MDVRDPTDVKAYERWLDTITIGGATPLSEPIELRGYDPEWPAVYERAKAQIRSFLGVRVMRIEHVGSTAVPGLCAKPVVDIALEVADSDAEETYVADLEAAGYALRIREPDWFGHRLFVRPGARVNLHVFSVGCDEVAAMLRFRDHIRANAADREIYASAKRELARRSWTYGQQYADAKSGVVREIMARA